MRFRNASNERIRVDGARMIDDTECCCGGAADCTELNDLAIPYINTNGVEVELIFPAAPPAAHPSYTCENSGTPIFTVGVPYIFTNPIDDGSGMTWFYETSLGTVSFRYNCAALGGGVYRVLYQFDGLDLTGNCSDASGNIRFLPLTVNDLLSPGELELIWPGIGFTFI